MALYPVPPGQQDQRLKLSEQGQSPTDNLLGQFMEALQQEPQAEIQAPRKLSENERLYLAIKSAREPGFREKVVDPLIQERATFPARQAAVKEAARQQRIGELEKAVSTVGLFDLRGEKAASEESKRAANYARAQSAFKAGGKPYKLDNIRLPDGSPGIEYGITDPLTGEKIPIGYRPKAVRGAVITNERGLQTVENPYLAPQAGGAAGRESPGASKNTLSEGGIYKQVSPGLQRDVAQSISTIDGFAELKGVYVDMYNKGGGKLGQYERLIREKGGNIFPGIQEIEDPEMANFVATRRASLNRYIKAVTGAQFSIAELQRYEQQLPGAGADPSVAENKIRLLAEQAVTTFKALVVSNGGLDRILADPELQKQLGILSIDPTKARAALGITQPTATAAGSVSEVASTPSNVPQGATFAGMSRSQPGKKLYRLPNGKLWREP